ncbi:MAG: endonuclease/exonuclease/phosphatase family protein [Bacteroidales bacterium]|nr:endonuclease/exonuclease/phosphatase family protein [Bacteroidales bacterium]
MKLGWFGRFMLGLNVLFIVLLALSHLSVHVSPAKIWLLPFFGLLYPYLVMANIFFIAWWLVKMKWLFILSLIILLSGWDHFGRTFRLAAPNAPAEEIQSHKLLSFNVKNLSNENVVLLNKDIRNQVIDYLRDADPDLMCLQEFLVIHPDPLSFVDSCSRLFKMPYHAYARYNEQSKRQVDAIIIFSRLPIINFDRIPFDEAHNLGVYADLLMDNDTVRLMNVHLESVRLKHEDYRFISEFDFQFEEKQGLKDGVRQIFRKLRLAYAKRAFQVERLSEMIRTSPYPVILCGDFNDIPTSYAYQQLTRELVDGFRESGRGFGNTYAGVLPSFRIDYILYDKMFTSYAFRRDLIELSDHHPISCLISKRIH